jgi:uncharacterized integral membrane protein
LVTGQQSDGSAASDISAPDTENEKPRRNLWIIIIGSLGLLICLLAVIPYRIAFTFYIETAGDMSMGFALLLAFLGGVLGIAAIAGAITKKYRNGLIIGLVTVTLSLVMIGIAYGSFPVEPKQAVAPDIMRIQENEMRENIRIKIRATPEVVDQGGTINVALDVYYSVKEDHTGPGPRGRSSFYFPKSNGAQFRAQKYVSPDTEPLRPGEEVWRYPADSSPAGSENVLLEPGQHITFKAEWNTDSTPAGTYVIKGNFLFVPNVFSTTKVKIVSK